MFNIQWNRSNYNPFHVKIYVFHTPFSQHNQKTQYMLPTITILLQSSHHIIEEMICILSNAYFNPQIRSILINSSSLNGAPSNIFRLSKICSGLDAPMRTLVTT